MNCRSALSPSRTVVTSFTPRRPSWNGTSSAFEEGDWVLCLASNNNANNNNNSVSAALSNGTVQVYDATSLLLSSSFNPGGTLQVGISNNPNGASSVITDLCYNGPEENTSCCVTTTAQDGSLVVTDLRQPATAALKASIRSNNSTTTTTNSQESALSVALGFDGYLAAVSSSKGKIYFFDLRNCGGGGGMLGSYIDSHTDAVVDMAFSPDKTSILVTGGEDGLVCCFDTTQPTEELALSSVMNIGAPLRKVGFCGSESSMIYCLTGSETASIWDANTANCIQDFGGNSLRQHLSSSTQQHIDYLVDAHWDGNELLLAAGNCTGDAALFSCNNTPSSSTTTTATTTFWKPIEMLVGGHRGVVRAWCPLLSSQNNCSVIVTAGEDARLCEWDRRRGQPLHQGSTATSSGMMPSTMTCGIKRGAVQASSGPLRRQRQRSLPSASPY